MYYVGQKNTIFTLFNYFSWLKSAVVHALICMYVSYLMFVRKPIVEDGENSDMWAFSVTFFTAIIIVSILLTPRS